MEFEWHPEKERANISKHGVSFEEAKSVFGDMNAPTFYDPKHSESEDRFIIIGFSANVRTLLVSYTDRHNRIRIISARKATRRERIQYETI